MPVLNKSQIAALIASNLPDNVTNDITPAKLREVVSAISESFFNLTTDKSLGGLSEWDSSKSYSLGKAVIYNNVIYKAITAPTATGSFISSEWQQISSYNEQISNFDDYLLIDKSVELDANRQVKALADGASLSNVDTGFYLVYTSASTGLNLDYPTSGKAFLVNYKSGLDTLQIFYPLNNITQYYTRKIGENWNFIDLQATADFTFSGGISEDEGEVKLGGTFDTVTLSGNDLILNTAVNFTGSVTTVDNIKLTEEQTGADDLTLITKGYVDTYLGSFASTSFVESAVEGLASETYVQLAIADIVDSAPSTLDTLNELSAALGNDENFATTVTNQIADKASTSWVINQIANSAGEGLTAGTAGLLALDLEDYYTDSSISVQSSSTVNLSGGVGNGEAKLDLFPNYAKTQAGLESGAFSYVQNNPNYVEIKAALPDENTRVYMNNAYVNFDVGSGTSTMRLQKTNFGLDINSNPNNAIILNDLEFKAGLDTGNYIQLTDTSLQLSTQDASCQLTLTNNTGYITAPNGLQYGSDYSENYTDRSLVDKAYVDNHYASTSFISDNFLPLSGGSITGNINVDGTGSYLKSSYGDGSTYARIEVLAGNMAEMYVQGSSVYSRVSVHPSEVKIHSDNVFINSKLHVESLDLKTSVSTYKEVLSFSDDILTIGSGFSDVEITSSLNGVILKSPNGTRYRITVTDNGTISTTAV